MKLHEKQKEVLQSRARFRVLNAGRRFGKTILAIEEMLFCASSLDGARIVYIAPTYQAARDICWEQLKTRAHNLNADINESRLELAVPNRHSTKSHIFLRSWDNIETLRGQWFNFIILDEVAMYRNFWTGWNEVLRPTLTDKKGRALFISTPKGFNWFYELYNMQGQSDAFKSFHATTYDNPHVDPKEIDEAKEQLPDDQFAQEYLADFRKVEGLVYKEFDRSRHIFTHMPNAEMIVEKRGGVDFGHTNPAGILTVYKTKDKKYYVTDEYYERGKVNSELIQEMASRKCASWYPDPAEPDRIEEMRRAGLSINEVSKNVEAGIDSVRALLKQNRLFFHFNCHNLIWEAETYRYKPRRADQNEPEEPIKENDHLLDCLRYIVHMWDNDTSYEPDEIDEDIWGEYNIKDI